MRVLWGFATTMILAAPLYAAPDDAVREMPQQQTYCVSANGAFYAYAGGTCEAGYQLASGNCRLPDGRQLAVSQNDCRNLAGNVELPFPPVADGSLR